jgi:predicted nucleic-acid-binding Zn-ribbon protein
MSNTFRGGPGDPGWPGFQQIQAQLSQATRDRISQAIDELRKRGVKNDYCPRCETNDWNVDLVEIPANSALSPMGLPTFRGGGATGYFSLLAVVCKNCGNTIFHNMEILGIPLR